MTATKDEQYRAGFEAWWEDHGQYSRAGGGDYEKTFAYNAWTAAKREASTEPSGQQPPGTQPCHLCEGQGFINQCVICGSSEPRTGSCGSDDPRALCNWKAGAGALPEEAEDAARMVGRVDDFGVEWGVTPEQAAKIDAAIDAQARAGKA